MTDLCSASWAQNRYWRAHRRRNRHGVYWKLSKRSRQMIWSNGRFSTGTGAMRRVDPWWGSLAPAARLRMTLVACLLRPGSDVANRTASNKFHHRVPSYITIQEVPDLALLPHPPSPRNSLSACLNRTFYAYDLATNTHHLSTLPIYTNHGGHQERNWSGIHHHRAGPRARERCCWLWRRRRALRPGQCRQYEHRFYMSVMSQTLTMHQALPLAERLLSTLVRPNVQLIVAHSY